MARFLLLILLVSLLVPSAVHAQSQSPCAPTPQQTSTVLGDAGGSLPFSPEIPIPGLFDASTVHTISGTTIAEYIRAIFVYFVWIVGLLAVVMIVFGGVRWVAAAGNPVQINDARDIVNNAIIGVIIVLTSVLLLQVINPKLTNLTGLVINPVSPCVIAFVGDAVGVAGELPADQYYLDLRKIDGSPTDICLRSGTCSSVLNQYVQSAGDEYSVDPILIKALILGEAKLDENGNPISGPTTGHDGTSANRMGSAYGVGQMTAETLGEQLAAVNKNVPIDCQDQSGTPLRQASGELAVKCQKFLDAHLELQVRMIAHMLKTILQAKQFDPSPTVLAAVYHLGGGGYNKFVSGQTPVGTTPAAAAKYLKRFNARYLQIYADSQHITSAHTK